MDDLGKHQVWDFGVPGPENYLIGSTINHNSGKSFVSCMDLALTLRAVHPYRKNYTGITIMQFTPTRGQAVDVIGKKLFDDSEILLPDDAPKEARGKPMIPPWEIAELNRPLIAGMRVPVSCTLKNGNRLLFSWSGASDQDKRIAGRRLDAVYIDEEAGTPELFAECAARLLDARSDPNKPGLGYLVWAYTNTRYNEAYENFQIRSEQGAKGHKTFILLPGENPAVNAEQREMLAGLMTEDQAAVRMRGGVDAGDLVSIYGKQWSDDRHILKSDYIIKPDDNLWVGYDPGVDHPTGMLVAAINKDSPLTLNFVKAWNYRGETIEKDANNLAEFLAGRRLAGFVYDTNLKNRDRGGGPSVLTRFKELLASRGIVPMAGFYQSKKNHAPGIALFRHYLDPNADDRTVPPLLVMSPPTPENGLGMFRAQILKYRGKEATKFTGAGGVVKKDDELCFVAGTKVLLADLSDKPIEAVAAGDWVLTDAGPRQVTAAGMTAPSATVIRIVFAAPQPGETVSITCTPKHRIFTQRGYVEAADLRDGDHASLFGCVEPCPFLRNDGPEPWQAVYDLTVDDRHCFYANGVLVHNCDASRYITMQRPSYNPSWACGQAVNMSTGGVAKLYPDDKIPTKTGGQPVQQPQFDFRSRIFLARSRDQRTRGAWREGGV